MEQRPQSTGQEAHVSPTLHVPLPHVTHLPQSTTQETHVSPLSHAPFPQLSHTPQSISQLAHVSPDAPLSMTVSAGPALDLPKPKLGRTDAKPTEAKGVEFEVPFVGKQPGKDELKAQMTFFICTEKICSRQQREVSVPVDVN